MTEVKSNVSKLVSLIYEYQKKIILNKKFIRELAIDGIDLVRLRDEIFMFERKIAEFQNELRMKYIPA